jgi:hypothetical protein
MNVGAWITVGLIVWIALQLPLGILIGKCIKFGRDSNQPGDKNS